VGLVVRGLVRDLLMEPNHRSVASFGRLVVSVVARRLQAPEPARTRLCYCPWFLQDKPPSWQKRLSAVKQLENNSRDISSHDIIPHSSPGRVSDTRRFIDCAHLLRRPRVRWPACLQLQDSLIQGVLSDPHHTFSSLKPVKVIAHTSYSPGIG